jgi:hypothetical protein
MAWNRMTYDECIRQGVEGTNVAVVGILGNLGKKYISCKNPHNRIFGVVLNHPFWEKDNFAMIEAANTLAKNIGYHYYLKLHPNYEDSYFNEVVDRNYYLGNIRKGIPILEYANMCEFSIVCSSSVFCELVYVKHRTIRFSTKGIEDKYRDVPYGVTFSNPSDIIDSYHHQTGEDDEKRLFDYLCGVEDVTCSYSAFLHELLNN